MQKCKISYSEKPFGKYKDIKVDNGFYNIYKGVNIPSRKSIFFSLMYNQIKDIICKNKYIYMSYDSNETLEFARFCSVLYSCNVNTYVLDCNRAVNNFVGGDVYIIDESINIVNGSKICKCVIFICSSNSGRTGTTISSIDRNYERVYKKCFVLFNKHSAIYEQNRRQVVDILLNRKSIEHLISLDKSIISENVNLDFINSLKYDEFENWISVEHYINRNIMSSSQAYIKRNIYGIEKTYKDFIDTIHKTRYTIKFDTDNIGILSCGVEGSGKSYLGEQLSKINGVVTIKKFSKSAVDRIIKHNTLYSINETSLYLFYLDESEKYLFNSVNCSIFKEVTGMSNFPKNIFIYATSNHHISEFDKSLYRTGRLQYQKWEYLTKADVKSGEKMWLDVLKTGVNIRYVDYIVKGDTFLQTIIDDTQAIYDLGVSGMDKNKESDVENRLNTDLYKILKDYNLNSIQDLTTLEKLSIRYKIDKNADKTKGWYMKKSHILDSFNIFNLDFYIYLID